MPEKCVCGHEREKHKSGNNCMATRPLPKETGGPVEDEICNCTGFKLPPKKNGKTR